jgi:hypothetical protein
MSALAGYILAALAMLTALRINGKDKEEPQKKKLCFTLRVYCLTLRIDGINKAMLTRAGCGCGCWTYH